MSGDVNPTSVGGPAPASSAEVVRPFDVGTYVLKSRRSLGAIPRPQHRHVSQTLSSGQSQSAAYPHRDIRLRPALRAQPPPAAPNACAVNQDGLKVKSTAPPASRRRPRKSNARMALPEITISDRQQRYLHVLRNDRAWGQSRSPMATVLPIPARPHPGPRRRPRDPVLGV